jgi:hypothetical protein
LEHGNDRRRYTRTGIRAADRKELASGEAENEVSEMTFWDFCAPFYDRVEHTNSAYRKMQNLMRDLTPEDATVFEAAAGTGSISLVPSKI